MAALSYNPLVAIQIALAGQAADVVKQHDGPTLPEAEQLPDSLPSSLASTSKLVSKMSIVRIPAIRS